MLGFWMRRFRQRMAWNDHLRPCRRVTAGLREVKDLRQQCRMPNELSITGRGSTPLDGNRRRCDNHRNHGHWVERALGSFTRTRDVRPRLRRLHQKGIRQGLATTRPRRSPLEYGAFRRIPPIR
jgi:hypothetical protein